MFIKHSDGEIIGVVKTSEDLTEEQKEAAEKVASDLSKDDEKNLNKKDN